MNPSRYRVALWSLLAAALVVRLALVLLVVPAVGYAGDLDLFLQWGRGLVEHGPGEFYRSVPDANYPPVAIWMVGGVYAVSHGMAGLVGSTADHVFLVLVKVPSVVADVATAALIAHLVRRRTGPGAALVAATVYLLLPVVWYDSVLWGQFDSIVAFGSLAALALLLADRPLLAEVAAVATMLFKPQGVLVVIVVTTVVVVTALRGDGDRLGRRLGRVAAAGAAALVTMLVLVVPFDLARLASGPWSAVPLVDSVAGFVAQSVDTVGLYPVLTANAFNLWALVGDPSLASSLHTGASSWINDSLVVFGMPANLWGTLLLGLSVALVVIGLVGRHDRTATLFAFTVLSAAFFAVPTRVHERYLVPVFATATVLAAGVLWRLTVVVAMAIVNTINLHAVLAVGSGHSTGPGAVDISLPVHGAFARSEPVVTTVSLLHSGAALALMVGWLIFVVRSDPDPPPDPTRP